MLPPNYEVPKGESNYLTLQDGENTFRVLSSAIIGWEGWKNKKPYRFIMDDKPEDVSEFDDERLNHFWAFVVQDKSDNKIKIMEITQKTIQRPIKALIDNEKWGDPKQYDITITKVGEKKETTYTVMPNPHSDVFMNDGDKELVSKIKLEALFTGDDPFGDGKNNSSE